MLPDYPKTKAKLWKHYMKVMEQAHQHHVGFFGEIDASVMHEGETDEIVREDGSIAEVVPRAVQSKGLIPSETPGIETIDLKDIVKALHEIGRGLADAKARMIV